MNDAPLVHVIFRPASYFARTHSAFFCIDIVEIEVQREPRGNVLLVLRCCRGLASRPFAFFKTILIVHLELNPMLHHPKLESSLIYKPSHRLTIYVNRFTTGAQVVLRV